MDNEIAVNLTASLHAASAGQRSSPKRVPGAHQVPPGQAS